MSDHKRKPLVLGSPPKVPEYSDPRALNAARFIIAHSENWITAHYTKKRKGHPKPDYRSYTIHFNADRANKHVKENPSVNWLDKSLLPVNWFYRFAMKGEYNMGWLNLKNVYLLRVLDSTGKTKRSYYPGLIPEAEFERKLVVEGLKNQPPDYLEKLLEELQ